MPFRVRLMPLAQRPSSLVAGRSERHLRGTPVVSDVQPQIVFHLASHVAGARELQVVLPTFYDNLASTVHLLTAVTAAGCRRIVLASSSEEPQNSDDNTFPCSPYTAAKWASSMYGRMFHQLFQTPVVMPRIFMTYGPAQRDVHKLVPFVIRRLLRGRLRNSVAVDG